MVDGDKPVSYGPLDNKVQSSVKAFPMFIRAVRGHIVPHVLTERIGDRCSFEVFVFDRPLRPTSAVAWGQKWFRKQLPCAALIATLAA